MIDWFKLGVWSIAVGFSALMWVVGCIFIGVVAGAVLL
jgi:hypothetical protein